jgi:hypothetical protein
MSYQDKWSAVKYLLVFFLSFFLSSRLFAQLTHWQSLGFKPDWAPLSFYVDTADDAMYITGVFKQVNDTPATVIKWDGLYYSRPHPAIRGATSKPMIKYKGDFYIFGNAGLNRIGKSDTSWERIDSVKRWVGCFYPYEGRLMVPGGIRQSNNTYKPTIGFWDGSTWSDEYNLDTLLNGQFEMIVSVAEYKGELYFAGNIDIAGKPQMSEIVRFDGLHWKDVGGGIQSGGLGSVGQLLVWKGDLYASGLFSEKDGAPGNCIGRWDGQKWHR